jgi:hypothetical protein
VTFPLLLDPSAVLANRVRAYDSVQGRRHDGRPFRMLTVIDGLTRECLAIDVARHLRSGGVLDELAGVFTQHGVSDHIRSDNGSEFTAQVVHSMAMDARWVSKSITTVKGNRIPEPWSAGAAQGDQRITMSWPVTGSGKISRPYFVYGTGPPNFLHRCGSVHPELWIEATFYAR